ncbi:HEAT repeat domain-containing protein [uncultured Methanocorpusculum sp.]|nr:HEAT repeat domain-containing protein [uncultured Methanocorpusculum sp.]
MDTIDVIARLSAENLDQRHEAVMDLAALGKSDPETVVPEIISAFKTGSMNLRWYLGRALIRIGPSVIPFLVAASEKETDMSVQKYYGAVFAVFGPEAVSTLVDLFSSKNPTTRGMAAAALEKIGDPSIPSLKEAAKSSDVTVKSCAILTLAKFQIYDY